jgi:hypothetical protein
MKLTTFKRPLILLLYMLTLSIGVIAQVPQKFNYQGIARDAKGNPLGEKQLALKISVLPTVDATVADYVETQQVSTNEFGLYTLQIGGGTPLLGDMKTVKWETGNKYIQVAIDPLGGTQYEVVGTTQLLSVPYAIYADKAGQARETVGSSGTTRSGNVSTSAAGTGTVNYLTKFVAANTIYNSQIFDNGTNVGIGTTTPSSRLHISTTGGNQEHLRMENLNPAAWGKFIFYNNNAVDYHTFTKYGTGIGGNYGGLTGFPYASLMVFGSNTAPTMVANANNIGFSLNYGSVAKLKYYAHHATGNVGIGGNATPAANVHFNSTDYTGDTLKITNTTSGHTAADGLDIRMSALAASVINRENSTLAFGTNNVERARIDATGNMGIGTITPTAKLEVAGQVKITGGVPGAGKVLTSDAAGLATWQTPTGGGSYTAGTGINITGSTISNTGDLSNTNEIQTLSIAGSTLSLSNGGGSVLLPSASGITGSGTVNYIPKFGTATSLTNSVITENLSNIGIGTTSPSTKLQVLNTGSNWASDFKTSLLQSYITVSNSSGINGYLGTFYNAPNLDFDAGTSANNTTGSFNLVSQAIPRLTINNKGNIGIHKTNPKLPMDITTVDTATTESGYPSEMSVRILDHNTTVSVSEKAGIYLSVGGAFQNSGVFAETNDTSDHYNFGLFGRVSSDPGSLGASYGGYFYDAVGAPNTYALAITGKMSYSYGSTSVGSTLTRNADGVAEWSGPVAFKATTANSTSVGINLTNSPAFYDVEYDESSSYDLTTGTFTAPIDGIYHFDYGVEISGNAGATSGFIQIGLIKNSLSTPGTYKEIPMNLANNTYQSINNSVDVRLLAGDQIQVQFYNASNAALNLTGDVYWTYFSGHRIR